MVERHAKSLQRKLALRARHFPEISGLRLIDAEGNVLYASDIKRPSATVANTQLLCRACE